MSRDATESRSVGVDVGVESVAGSDKHGLETLVVGQHAPTQNKRNGREIRNSE